MNDVLIYVKKRKKREKYVWDGGGVGVVAVVVGGGDGIVAVVGGVCVGGGDGGGVGGVCVGGVWKPSCNPTYLIFVHKKFISTYNESVTRTTITRRTHLL